MGKGNHFKLKLFSDIHEAICVRLSSTSLQPRLAIVGFTGTNGTDTPSNTQNRLLMVFMIYKMRQITALVAVTVRVWLDRGSVLSSAIACLSLNFCPTFRFFLSSH